MFFPSSFAIMLISKFYFITLFNFYTCITAIIYTENLSNVIDYFNMTETITVEQKANKGGYLLRAWRITEGGPDTTESLNPGDLNQLTEKSPVGGLLNQLTNGGGANIGYVARNVEPVGFISYKENSAKTMMTYVEPDAARAQPFSLHYHDGNVQFSSVGKDGVTRSISTLDSSFNIKMSTLTNLTDSPKFFYVASYGVTEQIYHLVSPDSTKSLGLTGEWLSMQDKGNYAFSVCDNIYPAYFV